MELKTTKKIFSEKFAILFEKYTQIYKSSDWFHSINFNATEYQFLYKKCLAIYANRHFNHCIFSDDKVVGCLSYVGRLFLSDSFDMYFSKLGVYCKTGNQTRSK